MFRQIRASAPRPRSVGLCLLLVACSGLSPDPWDALHDGEVMYRMDWSRRFEPGVPFVTNQGFEVVLQRAELNHWVLQLTPCANEESSSLKRWWTRVSSRAWAGHSVGDEALEISQFLGPLLEDLLQPSDMPISVRPVGLGNYCHAYWSVASVVDTNGEVLPSLSLEGTWRDLDDGTSGELKVASTINWGLQLPLLKDDEAGADGFELSATRSIVSWLRDGPSSFDEVDFRVDEEDAIARAVLRGLVGGVQMTFEDLDRD